MSDSDKNFDIMNEFAKAYDRASEEEERQRAQDGSVPAPLKEIAADLQEALDKTGTGARVMGLKGITEYIEQEDKNYANLVDAELGEDTVMVIKGINGEEKHVDFANGKSRWPALVSEVRTYKRRGDEKSLQKLMAVFPEASQLQADLQQTIDETKFNPDYEGFDPTVGTIESVRWSSPYDLDPGSVDFRKYVTDGNLDIDAVSNALFEAMENHHDATVDPWIPYNQTLDNIKRKFDADTRMEVLEAFDAKYREKHPS